MTPHRVLRFVRAHGVVLIAAKGPVPNVVEFIVGAPVAGSWWAHPKGREIFRLLAAITESKDVLVCRLVANRLTLVHRRVWPALARLAARLPAARLAQVSEEHTVRGHHVRRTRAFSRWLPPSVAAQARSLDEAAARALLAPWIESGTLPLRPSPRRGARR